MQNVKFIQYIIIFSGLIIGATLNILSREKKEVTFSNFFKRAKLATFGVALSFSILLLVQRILLFLIK